MEVIASINLKIGPTITRASTDFIGIGVEATMFLEK
jgi:hypothetical protein